MRGESKVSQDRMDALEARVTKLEQHLREATPALEEHEDRLDDHERRLASLQGELADVQRELKTLSGQVGRLADIATAQGLTLERVLRNTNRLVELLDDEVTPSEASGVR